jgi:polyisoprenoid-binding protein YceI
MNGAIKNPLLITLLGSVLWVAGCSDPAADVVKAPAAPPTPLEPAAAAAPAGQGQEYVLRAESTVGFIGSKVTGSHVGGFKDVAGKFHVVDGKISGTPEVRINMDSTWSDNERLTGHLKSPDFFDVEKYPVATFTIASIAEEGDKHRVTGNLDLHGVKKSISFPADLKITAEQLTLQAEFAINRKDFNINYPGKPNDLIRDEVVIKLDIKATPGPARPEDDLEV